METAHPVETLNLVLTHLTTLDDCESGCISQARGAEKERTEAKKERTSRRLSEHEWSLDLLLALALKQLVVLLLLALPPTRSGARLALPSLLLRSGALRLGEESGETGVTLRLEVAEVFEEVGLTEEVREALDRVGGFERGLFGAAGGELRRVEIRPRSGLGGKVTEGTRQYSRRAAERQGREDGGEKTHGIVELHFGNLLRTRTLPLRLDALGVVLARLVTHLEITVALDLVLLIFLLVGFFSSLRSNGRNAGDLVGLRDVVREGVLTRTSAGEVGREGGTGLFRGRGEGEMKEGEDGVSECDDEVARVL
jgi:hypothetical protein